MRRSCTPEHFFEKLMHISFHIKKGSVTIPHLPEHYTEAVDVCFVIVQTELDHFRSEIHRSSSHGTRDRFGFVRNTDIGYFGNILLRQLWENKINSMEIDTFLIPKSKSFDYHKN